MNFSYLEICNEKIWQSVLLVLWWKSSKVAQFQFLEAEGRSKQDWTWARDKHVIWAISYNTKLCVMINIQTSQKQIDENTEYWLKWTRLWCSSWWKFKCHCVIFIICQIFWRLHPILSLSKTYLSFGIFLWPFMSPSTLSSRSFMMSTVIKIKCTWFIMQLSKLRNS